MKCPNCGEEVEAGNLYCPNCLEEIPWVSEYNTMETIRDQHEHVRSVRLRRTKRQIRKKISGRRKKTVRFLMIILVLAVVSVAGVGYSLYERHNSYGYQYNSAEEDFQAGNYARAMEHIDRAIILNGSHEEAYCLMAEIMRARGAVNDAIKLMEATLADFPESEVVYGELLALYEEDERPESIKALLDNCPSVEIRNHFSDYIAPDPVINYDTGTYGGDIVVTISGDCDAYYYTLDGSEPSQSSPRYEKGLLVQEGTTELMVIGYNAKGIPSDVIYRKYVVAIEKPDPPEITPESGTYSEDTEITVEVPDGCTCYYAFDERPTESSTDYRGPIKMPEGTHTFQAVLVRGNRKSGVASRTYTLEY